MQLWLNASVVNCLEEQDGGHGSKTKGTVDRAQRGCSASLVAALVLGLVALGSGVLDLTAAEVEALNVLLVLEWLVKVAGSGDVVSRLKVEGTLDEIKLRSLDPARG